MLKRARASKLGQAAGRANEKARDKLEDAREYWETSQNPWVYRASSIWDEMTAETDEAIATRELRRLDPSFSLEEWKDQVVEGLCHEVLNALLVGDTRSLRPWLTDGVYERICAEIRQRKELGHDFGASRVLDIDRDFAQVVSLEIGEQSRTPQILLTFMAQQINCVRDTKTGDIIEGAEDDIRAFYYAVICQREYLDGTEDGADADAAEPMLVWKVVEFAPIDGADHAYL